MRDLERAAIEADRLARKEWENSRSSRMPTGSGDVGMRRFVLDTGIACRLHQSPPWRLRTNELGLRLRGVSDRNRCAGPGGVGLQSRDTIKVPTALDGRRHPMPTKRVKEGEGAKRPVIDRGANRADRPALRGADAGRSASIELDKSLLDQEVAYYFAHSRGVARA